jgi:hypothetical protein
MCSNRAVSRVLFGAWKRSPDRWERWHSKWLTSCMDNRCRSVLPIYVCAVRSVPNWREWRRRKRSCFVYGNFRQNFLFMKNPDRLWMCLWNPTCIRPRWGTCSWCLCLWLSWTRWWRRGEFDVLNPEPRIQPSFDLKRCLSLTCVLVDAKRSVSSVCSRRVRENRVSVDVGDT